LQRKRSNRPSTSSPGTARQVSHVAASLNPWTCRSQHAPRKRIRHPRPCFRAQISGLHRRRIFNSSNNRRQRTWPARIVTTQRLARLKGLARALSLPGRATLFPRARCRGQWCRSQHEHGRECGRAGQQHRWTWISLGADVLGGSANDAEGGHESAWAGCIAHASKYCIRWDRAAEFGGPVHTKSTTRLWPSIDRAQYFPPRATSDERSSTPA